MEYWETLKHWAQNRLIDLLSTICSELYYVMIMLCLEMNSHYISMCHK
jgi:hypothetical protein